MRIFKKNKTSITTLLYLPESLLDYHQHITVLSFLRLFDIVSLTKPILFELTNETILAHALKKLGDTTALSIVVIEDQQKKWCTQTKLVHPFLLRICRLFYRPFLPLLEQISSERMRSELG